MSAEPLDMRTLLPTQHPCPGGMALVGSSASGCRLPDGEVGMVLVRDSQTCGSTTSLVRVPRAPALSVLLDSFLFRRQEDTSGSEQETLLKRIL